MKNRIITIIILVMLAMQGRAQLSKDVAQTAMHIWKDSFMLENDKAPKWRYDQGVILKGIEGIWNATADKKYFDYIQKSMDYYVSNDGSIKAYKQAEFNIDNINNGRMLLTLYRVTGKEKYYKAATLLRQQLKQHPRTSEGSFWHKKIYPNQVWLDGLYMAQPFYAEYAMLFNEDSVFNDIAKQFMNIERHARNKQTGLLYHGWDESKDQKWADKTTGLSQNVWARALGWYGMALVDALEYFPEKHDGKDSMIAILNRFAKAVVKVQDKKTGLWYDVVDRPDAPKNYFEASASSMLVYTFAKAVRKGYIPAAYLVNAKQGYAGIKGQFIKTDSTGMTNLHGTVAVSGLGGNPYRDGTYEYYMSEPVVVDDPKGIGAFINAAVEMEMLSKQGTGKGRKVLLDNYFNNEFKKDASGQNISYHYTWEDRANSGFYLLGNVFDQYGFKKSTLKAAPTAQNLKNASIYIIVDADNEKETARPNFINTADVKNISTWVKAGGILVLMANDTANAELAHFNDLAKTFGVTFNLDSKNRVKNDNFIEGVVTSGSNEVFKTAHKFYIKEYASLSVTKPAKTIVTNGSDNVIAVAAYGKGKVFVIGDPWLYNEYTDGRKLPSDFDNYKAMQDLVQWLAKQAKN